MNQNHDVFGWSTYEFCKTIPKCSGFGYDDNSKQWFLFSNQQIDSEEVMKVED